MNNPLQPQQPQQSYTRTPGTASGFAQPQMRRCPPGQQWDAYYNQCKASPSTMPATGQQIAQPSPINQTPPQYNTRPQPVQQPVQSPYVQQLAASNVQNRMPQQPQQFPYNNNTQFLLNDIRRFFPNKG